MSQKKSEAEAKKYRSPINESTGLGDVSIQNGVMGEIALIPYLPLEEIRIDERRGPSYKSPPGFMMVTGSFGFTSYAVKKERTLSPSQVLPRTNIPCRDLQCVQKNC